MLDPKTLFKNMDELRSATWKAAIAVGAGFLLLFTCIFRVSNTTTLVILCSAAVVVVVSVVSTSRWRYLLLVPLSAGIWAQMFFRGEGNSVYQISVIARFLIAGLVITYFATIVSQGSQEVYRNMQRLAAEREEALLESQRWNSRLNALISVINAIGRKTQLRAIFTESLEEARKVFNADSGLIYSADSKTGKLSIISSFGYRPDILEKMKKKGIGTIERCLACTNMSPVSVENLATDEKCVNLAKVKSGSSVCLPITSGGRLWGVLHLRRKNPDAFSSEDIVLCQAITYQFAVAMQRASLFEQLNRLAITDPLTGLFNYRKLDRDIRRETVRSRRYNHSFSFIMSDIDHFKAVNDTYGHQVGDVILREVARTLDENRREVDRVYRYGGEEFAILLPETEWHDAEILADKLRANIESLRVMVDGYEKPLSVSMSMGVADYPYDSQEAEGVVACADQALYAAKDLGRNRVVTYGEIKHGPLKRAHPDLKLGSTGEGGKTAY